MRPHYAAAADLVCHWSADTAEPGSSPRRSDVFNPATGQVARFYTRDKSVMQRWPDAGSKGAEFAMPVNQ